MPALDSQKIQFIGYPCCAKDTTPKIQTVKDAFKNVLNSKN